MAKPNNRIALIGWSIVAAIMVCFFATVSEASEDPYAGVGYLIKDSVMDAWSEYYTEEQRKLAGKMGYTCHYMTTVTSAILESPDDGRLIETAHLVIDDVVSCEEISPKAQLRSLIEAGFTVAPYFENDVRDLDPENLFETLKSKGFKTVAVCTAEVYLITAFIPVDETIHEELAIYRVLDRHCVPIKE